MVRRSEFGDDFTWGVATAAYQIEGFPEADGKGASIWDEFTHRVDARGRTKIEDGTTGDVATESYVRYPEDLDLVSELGFGAYRFSLSWPRIQPDGRGKVNRAGIDHYRRMLEACLERGIEPWVTLYHWDLPQALGADGGWTDRETAFRFAEFCALAAEELGDLVPHWMVLNEPLSFTSLGYLMGQHAPGAKGLSSFLAAAHHANLALAHGARAVRAARPDADIGTTNYLTAPIGVGPGPLARQAERAASAVMNRLFLEPAMGLGYPTDDAPILRRIEKYVRGDDLADLAVDLDFMGVQYYTQLKARWLPIPGLWTVPTFGADDSLERTSMGWEVRPVGLGKVLDLVHSYGRYDRIVVTEGGASFHDELVNGRVHDDRRIAYYESHLREVANALDRGVPVEGYFAWSLLDNFEWAAGYMPRFGLVYVDYPTQQRTIKNSGYWFQGMLAAP